MSMSANPRPLLVITGPTGIGKTDLAMALGTESPLRVISADSVMVYQDLDIGSAKPTSEELAACPHDLIDLVPPEHPFDAGQFVAHAETFIRSAWEHGQVPCLVGGTIMYLKSLLGGLDALPAADPVIREQIRSRAESEGWPAMHAWLKDLDSEAAALIHPNHSSRIERALEVRLVTGESICSFWSGGQADTSIGGQAVDLSVLALVPSDREQLKDRLNRRFDSMLDRGFEAEVAALRQRPQLTLECPSMRSVGYRQMWQYLDGDLSEIEMKEQAKASTRQLAKRQLTWLRSWRADTNTFIEVSDSIPVEKGKAWLSRVLDRVL
jgi:tRNA dimethylallyltransferase